MEKALLIPINSKKEIFIQDRRRCKLPPWGYFGGGVEEGETPIEALVRETKEELSLDIIANDVIFIGSYHKAVNGIKEKRHLFLYKTEQESFTVLEGNGGCWLDFDTARGYLNTGVMFDKVIDMIKKKI